MASRTTRQKLSGREPWFRRCASEKVGYATYDEAQHVAELMMRAGKVQPGCHITPYECEQCPEWHVANRRIVFV